MPRGHKPRPLEERFADLFSKRGPDECWPWKGYCQPSGHARFNIGRAGTSTGAYRVAYELANGPIPKGMHVCHSCDNPKCVNPAHLWLGTHADNMRDRDLKGRGRSGRGGGRSGRRIGAYCLHGHEYSGDNLVIEKNGHAYCRECKRAANARTAAKKRRKS